MRTLRLNPGTSGIWTLSSSLNSRGRQEVALAAKPHQANSRELDLIQRILAGENELFEELIEPHTPRLMRAAVGVMADRDSAQDVVQEALIIAYENLGRFRGDGAFGGWLLRITVRQGLRTRRRLKMWLNHTLSMGESSDFEAPGQNFSSVDEVDRWLACLTKLPVKERTALILHAVEGHSHADIAEMMEATIGTVGSWIFRARQRLEERGLEDQAPARRDGEAHESESLGQESKASGSSSAVTKASKKIGSKVSTTPSIRSLKGE